MNKILKKANAKVDSSSANKYAKFSLSENPFPTMASVNESSPEKKYNGTIYEESIREEEYKKLVTNFLEVSQSNPDHLRLGFLSDTSYIGRGNGKTSFLVNLMRLINKNYCLDISKENNKCFSVYFFPEGGGAVKSFSKFVDYFFTAIIKSNVINEALAVLRFDAIEKLGWGNTDIEGHFQTEEDVVTKLNDDDWIRNNVKHYKRDITQQIYSSLSYGALPQDFPLQKDINQVTKLVSQIDFESYYHTLRGDKQKLEFVFTHIVNFLVAAGFNGAYVLVDDFERIPDFQSAMQKKDFAIQLRTVLFDGGYLNSRIGFYNFIIALHAGVPRLLQEAWNLAGMEQRVSISTDNTGQSRHIINFEKINNKHAIKLIRKYLVEYRDDEFSGDSLFPFSVRSIEIIANNSEMNISKILQNSNNIMEFAVESGASEIDENLVLGYFSKDVTTSNEDGMKSISAAPSIDLLNKIKSK